MSQEREPGAERSMELIGLVVILALALVLRWRHMDSLLPWFIFEDEIRLTEKTLRLLQQRTIDPDYFYYPAFSFYVNAVVYYFWAVAADFGSVLKHGPGAALDYLAGIGPEDPRVIMVSRRVMLVFGLAGIVMTHLLCRLYLNWRWALFATLLFALNPMHVSMSSLAKIDSLNLFLYVTGIYATVLYYRHGGYRLVAFAAISWGIFLVTKNNYFPLTFFCVALFLAGLKRERGLGGVITSGEVWVGFWLMWIAAFACSPFSFIHLDKSLENAGWLYIQAEVISTYHTDPHAWWLDRFHYLYSVVLPFVFGLPLFWLAVVGAAAHARKRFLDEPFVFINLVGFLYIFVSQSGGPTGGAMAYYLFLILVPPGILVGVEFISDLAASARRGARVAAVGLCALVFVWSLAGVDNQWRMFLSGYDQLGPWLSERTRRDSRVLMISVYKPGPALSGLQVKSVWPHHLTAELLDTYDPDVIVVDSWAVAGFRKVYREAPVAPLVDAVLSGERGHRPVKTFVIDYLGREYFASIDPEHDVEILVVSRESGLAREVHGLESDIGD